MTVFLLVITAIVGLGALGPEATWAQAGPGSVDPLAYITGKTKTQTPLQASSAAVEQEAETISTSFNQFFEQALGSLRELANENPPLARSNATLQCGRDSWPVSLIEANQKSSAAFSSDDLEIARKGDVWVSERPASGQVVLTAADKLGNVLYVTLPYAFFDAAMKVVAKDASASMTLLNAGGKEIGGSILEAEERSLLAQAEAEGALFTKDSLVSLTKIPAANWLLVIRHPLSDVNQGAVRPLSVAVGLPGAVSLVRTPKANLPIAPLALGGGLLGIAVFGAKRWHRMGRPLLHDLWDQLLLSRASHLDQLSRASETPERSASTAEISSLADRHAQINASMRQQIDHFESAAQTRELTRTLQELSQQVANQREWMTLELRRLDERLIQRGSELDSLQENLAGRSLGLNKLDVRLAAIEEGQQAFGDRIAHLSDRFNQDVAELCEWISTTDKAQEVQAKSQALFKAAVDEQLAEQQAMRSDLMGHAETLKSLFERLEQLQLSHREPAPVGAEPIDLPEQRMQQMLGERLREMESKIAVALKAQHGQLSRLTRELAGVSALLAQRDAENAQRQQEVEAMRTRLGSMLDAQFAEIGQLQAEQANLGHQVRAILGLLAKAVEA